MLFRNHKLRLNVGYSDLTSYISTRRSSGVLLQGFWRKLTANWPHPTVFAFKRMPRAWQLWVPRPFRSVCHGTKWKVGLECGTRYTISPLIRKCFQETCAYIYISIIPRHRDGAGTRHSSWLQSTSCPANERRRYFATTYLTGWEQS